MQGADADDLTRVYETESKLLDPWTDSPAEVTELDWRDHLGCREYVILSAFSVVNSTSANVRLEQIRYQRAFVDFFEDELVHFGYDWKQVVSKYLFSGKEPVFNAIIADRTSLCYTPPLSWFLYLHLTVGHPLIHLAYAFEMSSREIAMEALGLAATCYNDMHKYLDEPVHSRLEASYHTTSLFEILDRVRSDKQLDGLFSTPGDHNLDTLFRTREAVLLNHWNAWKIDNPIKQFSESQALAAALLVATHVDSSEKYDFFLVHTLTTSHAVRILLPLIPAQFQIPLVRQWWLLTLAVFIAQLRPEISLDRLRSYELNGRDWKWTANKAVKGEHSTDAHYVKAIRALREIALTWGDDETFYLKAAVKFADEFSGWGGFV